jgi:hypothetical protein
LPDLFVVAIYGIFFFGCLCGFIFGISANSYYTPKQPAPAPKPARGRSITGAAVGRVSVDLRRRTWQRIAQKPHAAVDAPTDDGL